MIAEATLLTRHGHGLSPSTNVKPSLEKVFDVFPYVYSVCVGTRIDGALGFMSS